MLELISMSLRLNLYYFFKGEVTQLVGMHDADILTYSTVLAAATGPLCAYTARGMSVSRLSTLCVVSAQFALGWRKYLRIHS